MVATVAENAGAHGLEAPEMGPMKYETIFRTSLSQTGAKSVSFYQGAVVRVRITFHGVGPVGWGRALLLEHIPISFGLQHRASQTDGRVFGHTDPHSIVL